MLCVNLNRDQIIALAPDSASVKAAEKLLSPAKWPLLQFNASAIWGECQGSGSNPYQSRIDLNGPAFKCSCPSRKFPCKHGLAMFLLYCDRPQHFTETTAAPAWVTEWIDSRQDKVQKKADAAANAKPLDEVAKTKRDEKRQHRVEQGIAELKRWLEDITRVGLGELTSKNYRYWEHLAARLVDAQAGGLANRVRQLGAKVMQGASHLDITAEFADLALLAEASTRTDQLPALLQQDIRGHIGWTWSQDDILSQPSETDQWQVWSHRVTPEDSLLRQDIVIQGVASQRFARLLQFAHNTQRATLLQGWIPGNVYDAAVHFYPGVHPLRAIAPQAEWIQTTAFNSATVTLDTMLQDYRNRLVSQPWLGPWPFVLEAVTPRLHQQTIWLHQGELAIPTRMSERERWQLLALSAAEPVTLMGEWNGDRFVPLTLACGQRLHALNTTYLGEA